MTAIIFYFLTLFSFSKPLAFPFCDDGFAPQKGEFAFIAFPIPTFSYALSDRFNFTTACCPLFANLMVFSGIKMSVFSNEKIGISVGGEYLEYAPIFRPENYVYAGWSSFSFQKNDITITISPQVFHIKDFHHSHFEFPLFFSSRAKIIPQNCYATIDIFLNIGEKSDYAGIFMGYSLPIWKHIITDAGFFMANQDVGPYIRLGIKKPAVQNGD
ncbi:MAG: hypothetical protein E3J87_08170 [Candidatus Cloacimonadota bacterium]|nr:MAG: hypothetical protein E3J87_08170 [Candidatus Cloacimonadota bacterium]